MKLHEAFSSDDSKKIYDNFLAIVNDPKRRDRLVRKYGKNAENVAYGTAVNQVKRQAANNIEEPQPEETMENNRLKEMVIAALTEKKKSFPDLTGDGKVTKADVLKARGVNLKEGVTDEIKDYFELLIQNQPEDALALIMDLVKNDGKNWGEWIDNIQADIVDTAGGDYEGDIEGYREELEEKLKPSMGAGEYVKDFRKSKAPQFKGKSKAKKNKMAVAAYLSAKDKIKEAILAKLKNK